MIIAAARGADVHRRAVIAVTRADAFAVGSGHRDHAFAVAGEVVGGARPRGSGIASRGNDHRAGCQNGIDFILVIDTGLPGNARADVNHIRRVGIRGRLRHSRRPEHPVHKVRDGNASATANDTDREHHRAPVHAGNACGVTADRADDARHMGPLPGAGSAGSVIARVVGIAVASLRVSTGIIVVVLCRIADKVISRIETILRQVFMVCDACIEHRDNRLGRTGGNSPRLEKVDAPGVCLENMLFIMPLIDVLRVVWRGQSRKRRGALRQCQGGVCR